MNNPLKIHEYPSKTRHLDFITPMCFIRDIISGLIFNRFPVCQPMFMKGYYNRVVCLKFEGSFKGDERELISVLVERGW